MAEQVMVIVVDDHDLFRSGLIELLANDPGLTVCGEGSNGADAIMLAREHRPDVAVLDIEMPGPGIRAVLRELLNASPRSSVIILSMHDEPDLVIGLIESGASAYLHKTASRVELAAAIRRASRHDDNVLLCVSRKTISQLARGHAGAGLLSAREQQVLQLLAQAKSNRDIGRELHITDGTVKRHLTNLYNKLEATSRLQAVRRADQLGLLATLHSAPR
jgi:DNA-binding NarL/FixJ family response regulator